MTAEEKRTAMRTAMDGLIYFNFNYPCYLVTYKGIMGEDIEKYLPAFFEDIVWTCDTAHMVGKYLGFLEDYGSDSALLHFYCDLDSENQESLLDWIIDNYRSK